MGAAGSEVSVEGAVFDSDEFVAWNSSLAVSDGVDVGSGDTGPGCCVGSVLADLAAPAAAAGPPNLIASFGFHVLSFGIAVPGDVCLAAPVVEGDGDLFDLGMNCVALGLPAFAYPLDATVRWFWAGALYALAAARLSIMSGNTSNVK